jgi:hypothetical protein
MKFPYRQKLQIVTFHPNFWGFVAPASHEFAVFSLPNASHALDAVLGSEPGFLQGAKHPSEFSQTSPINQHD